MAAVTVVTAVQLIFQKLEWRGTGRARGKAILIKKSYDVKGQTCCQAKDLATASFTLG